MVYGLKFDFTKSKIHFGQPPLLLNLVPKMNYDIWFKHHGWSMVKESKLDLSDCMIKCGCPYIFLFYKFNDSICFISLLVMSRIFWLSHMYFFFYYLGCPSQLTRTSINPMRSVHRTLESYPTRIKINRWLSVGGVAPMNCLQSRGVEPWILKGAYLQDEKLFSPPGEPRHPSTLPIKNWHIF